MTPDESYDRQAGMHEEKTTPCPLCRKLAEAINQHILAKESMVPDLAMIFETFRKMKEALAEYNKTMGKE